MLYRHHYQVLTSVSICSSVQDWAGVSDLAKDLISCLLVRCPRRRYTAAEVLEHPWIHLKVGAVTFLTRVS